MSERDVLNVNGLARALSEYGGYDPESQFVPWAEQVIRAYQRAVPEPALNADVVSEIESALARLIGDVHRVIALDCGDRGGEWNTALATLDASVDMASVALAAVPEPALNVERLATAWREVVGGPDFMQPEYVRATKRMLARYDELARLSDPSDG